MFGWVRMLRTAGVDERTRERALETIERNARAQLQLIEDLLDVSRIITGKLQLDVRPVDLLTVVVAALEAVRLAAEAKGIEIRSVLTPHAGPVAGDANRLQQIVWNLLSNALKFTPAGGSVEIRLERAPFAARIVVTDTGEGIDAEFLPHVFDRFRQAEGSSSRRHGGLGLGLAIVRHLVETHGGTVRAESAGRDQGAGCRRCDPCPAGRSGPPRLLALRRSACAVEWVAQPGGAGVTPATGPGRLARERS